MQNNEPGSIGKGLKITLYASLFLAAATLAGTAWYTFRNTSLRNKLLANALASGHLQAEMGKYLEEASGKIAVLPKAINNEIGMAIYPYDTIPLFLSFAGLTAKEIRSRCDSIDQSVVGSKNTIPLYEMMNILARNEAAIFAFEGFLNQAYTDKLAQRAGLMALKNKVPGETMIVSSEINWDPTLLVSQADSMRTARAALDFLGTERVLLLQQKKKHESILPDFLKRGNDWLPDSGLFGKGHKPTSSYTAPRRPFGSRNFARGGLSAPNRSLIAQR